MDDSYSVLEDEYLEWYLSTNSRRYHWCLAQKCKYSEPVLLGVQSTYGGMVSVTEYGFGIMSYTISEDLVLMFGKKKELQEKLRNFKEIKDLADKIKELL